MASEKILFAKGIMIEATEGRVIRTDTMPPEQDHFASSASKRTVSLEMARRHVSPSVRGGSMCLWS